MSEPTPPRRGIRGFLFGAADAILRRLTAAAHALHQGFWLGLMDHRHLAGVAHRYYTRGARWRDDDWNTSGLFLWEERALARHFPASGRLLVGAAGGGREAIALARRGFRVEAFECVPELVEAARAAFARLALDVRILPAAPGAVPEGPGTFEGLIVGWSAYMHVPGRAARVAFLRALRARAAPGAPVLLSFVARRGPSRSLTWTFRIASLLRAARLSRDPVEYGDTLDPTLDHQFTRQEVEGELREAGFEPVEWSDEPYGHAVGRAPVESGT